MRKIIIPIKTNNQRLPGKNTMILGDKPLYKYLFDTVKETGIETYIDSSDDSILEIAIKSGFNVIERPVTLNTPETSGNDLIAHAIDKIKPEENDIIGQFFVTTPFIRVDTILKSFKLLEENKEITSCFGVYSVYDRFWYNGKPVSHNKDNLEGTQYMKPLMREAGFYTFKSAQFKNSRSRISDKFISFEVEEIECVDIDTRLDFNYALSIVESGLIDENKKVQTRIF